MVLFEYGHESETPIDTKNKQNLMEHLCGENEIPKDIHAPPGKIVILYFESDESYNFRGFSLDWSKNCGGNVIVESQGQGLVERHFQYKRPLSTS